MNVNAAPWTPGAASSATPESTTPTSFHVDPVSAVTFPEAVPDFSMPPGYTYPNPPYHQHQHQHAASAAAFMYENEGPIMIGIKSWDLNEAAPPITSPVAFPPSEILNYARSYRDMVIGTHYVLLREDCTPDSDHIYSGFVLPIHDLLEVEVDAMWIGLAREIFDNHYFRDHNVYGVSICRRMRGNDILVLWCPQPTSNMAFHDVTEKIQQQLIAYVAGKALRLQHKVQFHVDIFSTVTRRICTVLVAGAPGTGKTLISKQIAAKHGLMWFSAADVLRSPQEAFKPWECQKDVLERLSQLLDEIRNAPNSVRGIVLDCQGRSVEEHCFLDSLLRTKCMPLCTTINLRVKPEQEEELIDRAVKSRRPEPRQKADKDRVEATQRDKLRAYRQVESKLWQLYDRCDALHDVDAMMPQNDLMIELDRILTTVLRSPKSVTKAPEYPLEKQSFTFVDDYVEYFNVMEALARLTPGSKKPGFPAAAIGSSMSRATMERKRASLWEYKVSHKVEGQRVLVVHCMNKLYCVPEHMRCVYALNTGAWVGNANLQSLGEFVLDAAMAHLNSTVGHEKLIVFDVLAWNSQPTTRKDWDARHELIQDMPDELSIPVPHPNVGIAVVRKHFFEPFELQDLLRRVWLEYPVDGLLFTPKRTYRYGVDDDLVHWRAPVSLTACFSAGQIVSKGNMLQVRLEVHEADNTPAPARRFRTVEYKDEFVEVEPQVFRHVQCQPGDIVECMLVKEPGQSHHCWEFLRKRPDRTSPDTKEAVETLVREGMVTASELMDFYQHAPYDAPHPSAQHVDVASYEKDDSLCAQCGSVNPRGRCDPDNKKYYCPACWETYGYGDCRQCKREFFAGQLDPTDKRFYCFECWEIYKPQNKKFDAADKGATRSHKPPFGVAPGIPTVMPPLLLAENAPYKELMNLISGQLMKEATTEASGSEKRVLELGCGRADDLKKWVFLCEGLSTYVGTDIDPVSLQEARKRSDAILSQLGDAAKKGGKKMGPHIDFLELDSTSKRFWVEHLPDRVPELFHIISSQFGLHHAFRDVKNAYTILQGIADSLEPGGVFVGTTIDDSVLYDRYMTYGKMFGNDKYTVLMDDAMGVGVSTKYKLCLRNHGEVNEYFVPWARLEAVTKCVGLEVVATTSCLDRAKAMLSDAEEGSMLPPLTREDEDFLALLKTFIIKKK
eukprot:PhM_4_TR17607/c0_g2_i1/m.28910